MPRSVRSELVCAGVDGCKNGWVIATRQGVSVVSTIAEVIARDFAVIAIDMPIGLPSGEARRCEPQARRFISPRGSTIFPTPVRACLTATDYWHACAISRDLTGRAISKQVWHILPKIRELDAALDETNATRVVEAHPECSFAVMNDGRVLTSKHHAAGRQARLELIEREFGPTNLVVRGAARDDVLDAHAVLWTAERFSRGGHRSFPVEDLTNCPQLDQRGLPMRIVV